MEGEPDPVTALSVLLAEIEDAIAHDDPRAYVGVEAAVARLTTDCDDPNIGRLSHAPHRVEYELTEGGDLKPYGESELLDAPWDETASYWCRGCDTEMTGYVVAVAHAHGIDLSGMVPPEEREP